MAKGSVPAQEEPYQDRRIALYYDPHSLFCAKTKIVLMAKGVEFTSRRVAHGYTKSAEFRKFAPLGKIPVLVVEEEELESPMVIWDSEAINEWVEDGFPESAGYVRLMPFRSALRAMARGLSRFHDLHLEAALRKTYRQIPIATRDASATDAAAAEYEKCIVQLEELLMQADEATDALMPDGVMPAPPREHPGYCVGRALSLADSGFGPTFLYADLIFGELGHGRIEAELDNGTWPRVQLLREALRGDPHVSAVLAEMEPAAEAWLQGQLQK